MKNLLKVVSDKREDENMVSNSKIINVNLEKAKINSD